MAVYLLLGWRGYVLSGVGVVTLAILGALLLLRPPRLAVPEPGTVLHGVTLIEPGSAPRRNQTLVVTGTLIERIAPSAAEVASAEGSQQGGFVLPGLVDLHVHHPPSWALAERELYALLFLAHGITSVRDVGSVLSSLAPHQARIAEGRLAGPRVFRCGPVLDGEPAVWPGTQIVEDAEGARRSVARLADDGVDCIKLYNGLAPETVEALLQAAAAQELPVVAHVPSDVSVSRLQGAEVQHLMGLTRNWNTVSPERVAWYVQSSLDAGIAHTPTLAVFRRHARIGRAAQAGDDPALRLLPSYYAEILWNPEHNPLAFRLSPAGGSTIPARPGVMRGVVASLHDAGVALRVGSDAGNLMIPPGAGLHEELRELVAAGLTPGRVWELATWGAGEALRHPALGRLKPGAPADLLVFREDPTRDLAALESLSLVVADGRAYSREQLDAALLAWRQHASGRLYERVGAWTARALLAASPDRP